MARIPESEIERLKAEISVERLVEASGIELKPQAGTGSVRAQFDVIGEKVSYRGAGVRVGAKVPR